MTEFHFIRPEWLLAFIPLIILFGLMQRNRPALQAWSEVCDEHLLSYLMQHPGQNRRTISLLYLFASAALIILSLSGPSWSRFPVPAYQPVHPHILILDMSDTMLMDDLSPSRLSRAKFKLHDLFKRPDVGQFGLVVYSGEPFVVSPLTDDAKTIEALLSSLTVDIMPVEGQRLDLALEEAEKLIQQAGFQQGDVLVLSAETPSNAAIDRAAAMARAGIHTSLLPVMKKPPQNALYERFVKAGHGQLIPFSETSKDIEQWLNQTTATLKYQTHSSELIPVWRDEGRWFLIPALLLLLPVFRRGWLQRINT